MKFFLTYLFKNGFMILGGCWTIIEILESQHKSLPPCLSISWISLYIVIGIIIFYYFKPFFRTIKVAKTGCALCIRPGNIVHAKKGTIVVGVNGSLSYDKNEIGENSIHYQLMQTKYKDRIESELEHAKAALHGTMAPYGARYQVKDDKWNKDFIFLVMSTLPEPRRVDVDQKKLRSAIIELFRDNGNYTVKNGTLLIPLIGTGAAGATIEKSDVIKWIGCAYCAYIPKDCHTINKLIIKVCWRDYLKVNIRNTIETLNWMSKECCILTKSTK